MGVLFMFCYCFEPGAHLSVLNSYRHFVYSLENLKLFFFPHSLTFPGS